MVFKIELYASLKPLTVGGFFFCFLKLQNKLAVVNFLNMNVAIDFFKTEILLILAFFLSKE